MPGDITIIATPAGAPAPLSAAAVAALRRAQYVLRWSPAGPPPAEAAKAAVEAAADAHVVYLGGAPGDDPTAQAIAEQAGAAGISVTVVAGAGGPDQALGGEFMSVGFDDLVAMMAHLRSPQGCPWDREQSHRSLRPYMLEEAYEVIDAIDQAEPEKLRDELGDVLLQVLFHAQMASEAGEFAIGDVLAALSRKLKGRHVHVWGDLELSDAESVLESWERIKRRERGHDEAASVLADVPPVLPALMRAQEISRKAARTGFDWSSIQGPLAKLEEEIAELRAALAPAAPDSEEVAREIGDLGIALVNVARWAGIDAETAVREAAARFVDRFRHLEQSARARGCRLEEMSIEEMDGLWEEAKRERGSH